MKRKICIVTGSRAEYGLLRPLLKEVSVDPELTLQLVVTGMHLSEEFGSTYKEIESDGFNIDEKIDIGLHSDTPTGIAESMGLAMSGFAKAYERVRPDIVVVLGDRFEIFIAAAAATVSRCHIAHLHGGERTEGVIDEVFRHSITKMSHLHFASTEEYRRRIIQLGEDPSRVFNVGAIGLDNIRDLKLLAKEELEDQLNTKFNKHNLLVTFHPVTLEDNTSGEQFQILLDVLNGLKDTNIIFTKSNADTGGRAINNMIDEYVLNNSENTLSFASMGQLLYLSTLQFVDAMAGNSSSGIIEAPSFKIGTINIGDRQKGRIKAESIINCQPLKDDINRAFQKLYSKEFQKILKNVENPYGTGGAAKKIKEILKKYDLCDTLKKNFYDINFDMGDIDVG